MKIAVCMHGLSSGVSDLAARGSQRTVEGGFRVFIDGSILNVFDGHEVDFFTHTWGNDSEELINQNLKPISSVFEEQIQFAEKGNYLHSIKSRWYSAKRSVELLAAHRENTGADYDFAFLARFDVRYFSRFDLHNLDSSKFYASHWVTEDADKDGLLDYWFLSNPEAIIKFSSLYENIEEMVGLDSYPSSHWLAIRQLQKTGLRDSLVHLKREKLDFDLTRRLMGVKA